MEYNFYSVNYLKMKQNVFTKKWQNTKLRWILVFMWLIVKIALALKHRKFGAENYWKSAYLQHKVSVNFVLKHIIQQIV